MRYTLAILATSVLSLIAAPGLRAADYEWYGKYQTGNYTANRERVVYFLIEYQGTFNVKNSQAAADYAVRQLKNSKKTMVVSRHDIRTAADKHLVIGWHNLDRNKSGWVAASTQGGTDRCAWIDSDDRRVRNASGWVHRKHKTNGFNIGISVADDDRGNMAMSITTPQ